ncbi:MAG TPA: hypothetical protein PKD24_11930 [Pyrinomonadaceae bacterium]|nr:hypothetical protein [Pyrinomonadaceae bacterium]HMP65957.1 hypothetical protein [Pyrinomonadaceae bacterium]
MRRSQRWILVIAFGLLFGMTTASELQGQTTGFSFQGKLTDNLVEANGPYDLTFKLFDQLVNGDQIGPDVIINDANVVNGIFTVELDFGAAAFTTGEARFLQIEVRPGASSGEYTILSPRQQIKSSPFAIKALDADTATTASNAVQLGGIDASEYVTSSSVDGTFIKNAAAPQQTANFNISGNGFFGGRIGIGTTSPASGLEIRGTGFNSQQRVTDATSGNSLVLQSGAGENLKITGFNYGSSMAVPLYLSTDGAHTILNSGGGNVGIGAIPSVNFRLDVSGGLRSITSSSASIVSQTTGGQNAWARFYMRTANRSWFIGTSQAFNGDQFYLQDETAGQYRLVVAANGNVGIGTTNPTQRLSVEGTTRTGILQITGGSDLAEHFEMADTNIIPGMVVAIDPANTGRLILARGAYDRRVAGIVSGANNLVPGMLLPNLSESDDVLPVALSGRVWVFADATSKPIRPGDLLTSSNTPGYAMKVRDHRRANGAIIGKAMTELRSGKGMVLVLVSLQ